MHSIMAVVLIIRAGNAFNARVPGESIIRPHTRFMVQSIVDERVGQDALNKIHETCPAPSTLLFGSDEQPLLGSHRKSMGQASKVTQTFLDALSESSSRDDVRRVDEYKEAWSQTILVELGAIKEAVNDRMKMFQGKSASLEQQAGGSEMKQGGEEGLLKTSYDTIVPSLEKLLGELTKLGAAAVLPIDFQSSEQNAVAGVENAGQANVGNSDSARLVGIIASQAVDRLEEFKTFIEGKTLQQEEKLSRLMTTLGILRMRQEGLKNAQKRSSILLEKMKKMAETQINGPSEMSGLNALLQQIADKVGASGELAKTVFKNARELSVEIDTALISETGHLDEHIERLTQFVGTDPSPEFTANLKFALNNLFRLHASIAAFSKTYPPDRRDMPIVEEPVISKLQKSMARIGKIPETKDLLITLRKQVNMLTQVNKHVRGGANCIMYGRVDSLLASHKMIERKGVDSEEWIETDMCTSGFYDLVENAMKEMQLGPDGAEKLNGNQSP